MEVDRWRHRREGIWYIQEVKTPHTSTYKGKRVYIRLKTGERIVGKFQNKNAHFLWIDERKIPIATIKAFSIWRGERRLARGGGMCYYGDID